MIPFLENTWIFWWLAAIVLIIRWFHLAVQAPEDSDDPVSASEVTPTLSPLPEEVPGNFINREMAPECCRRIEEQKITKSIFYSPFRIGRVDRD